MDRSAFIFALKSRVAGEPQKETLIGVTMNKIFDGINELARIGIRLEVHEEEAIAGSDWPAWAKCADGKERLVDSQEALDALGAGWELKAGASAVEQPPNLLFSSGGASSERRISDAEHASNQAYNDGDHPVLSLQKQYAAPAPVMTDAEAINGSLATKRAQSGSGTPDPLNSPETGNVEQTADEQQSGDEQPAQQ